MNLIKSSKDAIDYHWSQTSMNCADIYGVLGCLKPEMLDEMLDLWLESKGFTQNGVVKQELIEEGYFHRKTCYGIRNGYEQEIGITRKGIDALGRTFKSGRVTGSDCDTLFEEPEFAELERSVRLPNGETLPITFSSDEVGNPYTKYGEYTALLDIAKIIAKEDDRINDFMLFAGKKRFPDGKDSEAIYQDAEQVIKVKYLNGSKAEEVYPFILVTAKGVDELKAAWIDTGCKLSKTELLKD